MDKTFRAERQRIYALLTPPCIEAGERRALLARAFPDDSALHADVAYEGSANQFVPLLVARLLRVDGSPDAEPALWTLLLCVREQIGVAGQREIDGLQDAVREMARNAECAADAIEDEQRRKRGYGRPLRLAGALTAVFATLTIGGWFWNSELRNRYVFRYPPKTEFSKQKERVAGYVRKSHPELADEKPDTLEHAEFLKLLSSEESEAWEPSSVLAVRRDLNTSFTMFVVCATFAVVCVATTLFYFVRVHRL